MPHSGGRISPADLLGDDDGTITLDPRSFPSTEAFLDAVREAQERQRAHVR